MVKRRRGRVFHAHTHTDKAIEKFESDTDTHTHKYIYKFNHVLGEEISSAVASESDSIAVVVFGSIIVVVVIILVHANVHVVAVVRYVCTKRFYNIQCILLSLLLLLFF